MCHSALNTEAHSPHLQASTMSWFKRFPAIISDVTFALHLLLSVGTPTSTPLTLGRWWPIPTVQQVGKKVTDSAFLTRYLAFTMLMWHNAAPRHPSQMRGQHLKPLRMLSSPCQPEWCPASLLRLMVSLQGETRHLQEPQRLCWHHRIKYASYI